MRDLVDLVIKLRVLDFQMSLLDQVRDLFEFLESIIGVMHHYPVEDLSEVGVQIQLDRGSAVLGFLQLLLDALESFRVHTHIY